MCQPKFNNHKVVWNVENFICHFSYIICKATECTDHFYTKNTLPCIIKKYSQFCNSVPMHQY